MVVFVISGCATTSNQPAAVERMYVISCGENHVKDLARFTGQPADKDKAVVFSDYCYLIEHARGWMLWDTGNADRLAAMPNGMQTPVATAYMKKPLAESLKELGVAPAQIQHFAMSHHHGDHDVFGDGSVVIKPTPGHTPGHQSLAVRLPKTGLVLLSGDMVHQSANWEAKRAPSFNFNVARSVQTMQEVETFMQRSGAKLWINHDMAQNASIPKAPAFVE